MQISRTRIIEAGVLSLVLAALAWYFLFSGYAFYTHGRNAPNRTALLQIHSTVPLGASYEQARTLVMQHVTPKLTVVTNDPTSWLVGMPLEFGATDWNLRIEFRDGRVSALRIRTSDGPPPKDAPKDKEF